MDGTYVHWILKATLLPFVFQVQALRDKWLIAPDLLLVPKQMNCTFAADGCATAHGA